jgi:Holliday junction DNA helicase RuvB
MARERIVSAEHDGDDDQPIAGSGEGRSFDAAADTGGGEAEQFSWALRPKSLAEYIGQRELAEKLRISITAARGRDEPLEHVLLHGPPGLGKTTLAHIIAAEMRSKLVCTSGPTLERAGDLLGILTNLDRGDVLFVDEIHRLGKTVEEYLYPAMEDFRVDFVVDKGTFAKTINVPLKGFTLIGATTRAGMLSEPLRNRFGITHHLDFYTVPDLATIVTRAAGLLETGIDADAAEEIARRRSRPTAGSAAKSRRGRSTCGASTTSAWTTSTAATSVW